VVIALLALLGVPLWFCAIAISVLLLRNRSLRKRRGNIPARIRMAPGKRWIRGHGLWVHDVWAFRGSPAAWNEKLVWVTGAHVRATTDEEAKKLHRLDERPVIVMLQTEEGTIEIAGAAQNRTLLLGPYAPRADRWAGARLSEEVMSAAQNESDPRSRREDLHLS
jgi:hypothetical protein